MAERTLRRNKGRDTATASGTSDNVAAIDRDPIANGEPVTIEPDGTIKPTTIDDYVIDEPNNGTSNTFVDPNTGSSSGTGSNTGRRTRSDAGKPRGRRTRRDTTETTDSVASMLFAVHLGMSNLMNSELLALTKEESEAYAKAVTNVSQYYDIPVIGEKAMAWVNLCTVMGSIYGPRFLAAKMQAKKNKKPSEVIEMKFTQPATGVS